MNNPKNFSLTFDLATHYIGTSAVIIKLNDDSLQTNYNALSKRVEGAYDNYYEELVSICLLPKKTIFESESFGCKKVEERIIYLECNIVEITDIVKIEDDLYDIISIKQMSYAGSTCDMLKIKTSMRELSVEVR